MKTMNAKDYVFSTTLDIEALNIRMIDRIDGLLDKQDYAMKFNLDGEVTNPNLLNYPEFQEFSVYVEEFARESSVKRNYDHPHHSRRVEYDVWYDMYIKSQKVGGLWAARYKSGQGGGEHDHWPCTWAFTYYIDPPENASGLYFTDIDDELPIDHGRLHLFGGNMLHRVKPSTFDGYRYCIAGTISTHPPTSASRFND